MTDVFGPPSAPWVAYVGPMAFPEGGAAARRILGNAQAIAATGRRVVIVSGQSGRADGAIQQVAPGISCVAVNERDADHLPKLLRYARYLGMGRRSRSWIAAQPTRPEAIILYSGYAPYLLQFTGWTRREGIPLIFDAVEWYTAPTIPAFLLSPYHWSIELTMRMLIPRADGVIAISRALERYYRQRGVAVVRIPPILDMVGLSDAAVEPASLLRLAYAGSPGRKDCLGAVVAAVIAIDRGQGRLRLDIAGVTQDELRRSLRTKGLDHGELPASIVAHGPVPHERAQEIVGRADFSVLLRRINRVSTCGFPTKIVESLALGTPVIANISSDLADCLRDGETGIVCGGPDAADLRDALERAMAMSFPERAALRVGARAEAQRAFDYRVHVETMASLLNALAARTNAGTTVKDKENA